MHTDRHIQKYKKEGLEQVNSHLDELHKQATTATARAASASATNAASSSFFASGGGGGGGGGRGVLKPPQKPLRGIPGFFSALSRVIQKDLGILDKK